MLTLWIAIPLSLITLVAAGARRRPPADNSNCVSLVIEEARFISVNDTIGEWTCKQGELCQAPYAENAYSLSKTNFAWDKYNSAPDPCAVDGACAIHTNYTLGELCSIYGCCCRDIVYIPRVNTSPVQVDGKTFQCDLKSIQGRLSSRNLAAARVSQEGISCLSPPNWDNTTCVCNVAPRGIPSTKNGNACSKLWDLSGKGDL